MERKGAIWAVVAGSFFFLVLLLLLILKWISVVAFIIIIVVILVLAAGIGALVFFIRKTKQQIDPDNDGLTQNISHAELIQLAKETVLNDLHDHFMFKNVVVRNVGGRGRLTPIAMVAGYGDVSKKEIMILINLHKPKQIPCILLDASDNEVRDAMDGMANVPAMKEVRVVKRRDSLGNEVEETTESNEIDVVAEEAKKESDL